ncbi:craniofacial development protein 1 [Gadus chalcogrammus]|uniref:craniofacial development protein 1 n=1 Tax=Gadus chalcogrammus TaxID=1042646 RepID=UPI0024C47F33|nr:craniofacial development protein 1 [Gadus chalcogrammus]
MNYSDYDSDGYSSNADADYVPSADNLSEDDMNECVKEDPLDEIDGVPQTSDGSKKKTKTKTKRKDDILGMRKRKKGILKVDGDKEEGNNDEGTVTNEKDEEPWVVVAPEEVKQKKKADDLWASFLSDVGTRPKPSASPEEASSTEQAEASSPRKPTVSLETKAPEPTKPAESSTVTITKVFDFAGEEVRVTKEVAADSREAKDYLKTQSSPLDPPPQQQQPKQSSAPVRLPGLPGPSVKRAVGMSGILGQIGGKKQKMSTLEKSKMDWDTFKSEEGITEELAIHNRGKEGYVERKNFLERVDHRQFEREKEVRLTNMKR